MTVAAGLPIAAEAKTAMRPAAHRPTSAASGNAGDRQAAGPVRDRRQEETCDNGAAVAEEHFMGVPVDRRKFVGR